MKQHLKSIVWPREKQGGAHRYIIVGMVVTDEPIPEFEGKDEILLDGQTFGLSDILATINQRKPNHKIGDATNVLLSLSEL